jgi:predicted MPP superfamily phosphohydrolase
MNDPTAVGPSPWARRGRFAGRWALRGLVAVVGALLAVVLFGRISAPIGPFDATFAFRPAGGGAEVAVPPLGALAVDAYDGPLRLEIQLQRVDQERARALAGDPVRLAGVVNEVTADLRSAVVRLAWTTAGLAVTGAALASLLVYRRRWQEPLLAIGITTGLLVTTAGLGAATWRPEALSQPKYTGLLVNANSLIGSAEDIAARFDAYRASLEDLVANVGSLYSALSALPAPGGMDETVALLHVSDIHLNPAGFDLVAQVVEQFQVDGVLDTGDITDWGSQPENRLITSVGSLDVPYVFIRGNHDSAATAGLITEHPNATVLDLSSITIAGIHVVGTRDPRFTPDKTTGDDNASDLILTDAGEDLAEYVATLDAPPALALVHDPKLAAPLDGVVPLVLAGHTHERKVTELEGGTRLMTQGSTGGAGLRALQGEYPEPLTCTVLYLDPTTGQLRAYDEITLGGLGETEVTIQRTVVPVEDPDIEEATPEGSGPDATEAPASPSD